MMNRMAFLLVLAVAASGCGEAATTPAADAGAADAGAVDAGAVDAGAIDAGVVRTPAEARTRAHVLTPERPTGAVTRGGRRWRGCVDCRG